MTLVPWGRRQTHTAPKGLGPAETGPDNICRQSDVSWVVQETYVPYYSTSLPHLIPTHPNPIHPSILPFTHPPIHPSIPPIPGWRLCCRSDVGLLTNNVLTWTRQHRRLLCCQRLRLGIPWDGPDAMLLSALFIASPGAMYKLLRKRERGKGGPLNGGRAGSHVLPPLRALIESLLSLPFPAFLPLTSSSLSASFPVTSSHFTS